MKAVGIDLGTTNSAAAYFDPARGSAAVLHNREGETLTPSVVAMRLQGETEKYRVGRTALNGAASWSGDTVFSVKRLMGMDFDDPKVQAVLNRVPYTITRREGEEDARAYVRMGGRLHTPAEISGRILEKLRTDAGAALGEPVTDAVITVPAYFSDSQRAATREAAEKAGLRVRRIIDEPTAAAVAFGVKSNGERHRVLVFDLGGGTFDISILHVATDREGAGQFQVLTYVGDPWLGGDDFDHVIMDRIVDWVRGNAKVDPLEDTRFTTLAKEAAERAKRELSQSTTAEVLISGAVTVGGAPIDVDLQIDREDFEAGIDPYVDKAMQLVAKVLGDQSLLPEDITDVLLVGGGTLTPKVHRVVESYFGAERVRRNLNPMECVAIGAGVLAAQLRGRECPACGKVNDEAATDCDQCQRSLHDAQAVGTTNIHDVTGMDLGIAVVRDSEADVFFPMIPRGTPYPLAEPVTHSFKATDGRLVRVPVYQGERERASQNAEQGVIEYELPEKIGINDQVDVTFNYDSDKVVQVTIAVPGTAMRKTEGLRTDRARASTTTQAAPEEDPDANWEDEFLRARDFSIRFFERYEPYLDEMQKTKIRNSLEQAERAYKYRDPVECRRITNVLRADVFGSGTATQLLLAEQATEGATPEVTQAINEAVSEVRKSFDQGNAAGAAEQARLLRTLVARAMKERTSEAVETEDYGGLLKV